MSLLTDVLKGPVDLDEEKHRVSIFEENRRERAIVKRGAKLSNTVRGVCYVAATRASLRNYWLRADGRWYRGDRQIREWVGEHLPVTLAMAERVKAEHDAKAVAR